MATDDVPQTPQVPVLNLTFDYILTPLIQLSARRAQERAASAQPSEMDQQVQQLSDLARQLKDVIDRINATDSTVLAKAGQGQQEQPPIR
jgi:hypothetical protein